MMSPIGPAAADAGLYDPTREHDACGLGFIAHIKGEPSHELIAQGLEILTRLGHRGAVGADPMMGDGAGILIQIPHTLLRCAMARQNVTLPEPGQYGAGMIFLPAIATTRQVCEQAIEQCIAAQGLKLLGWRNVPVDHNAIQSATVRASEPVIRQVLVCSRHPASTEALERSLYRVRKAAEQQIHTCSLPGVDAFFIASLSVYTMVYKGLLLPCQLSRYYRDLCDPQAESALAIVHQRFSTNTFPAWKRAHPFHMIAHNGEINTIRSNINGLAACRNAVSSRTLGPGLAGLWPIASPEQSDTACLDNGLALLVRAGYPLARALTMMMPEAWEQHTAMDGRLRAFYDYHAALMAPWDGPAALVFTDGHQIGALLDRNGLRPIRYVVTDDHRVILASEAGVLPIPEKTIVRKRRLHPGSMLLIDISTGQLMDNDRIRRELALASPCTRWLARSRIHLESLMPVRSVSAMGACDPDTLRRRQQAFGYTREDLKFQLDPMAQTGAEAVGSMGDDRPLAVLSDRPRSLYDYFRQRFAQITNPAIDPIRERLVMSLTTRMGPRPNLLDPNPQNWPIHLEARQPLLNHAEMATLRHLSARSSDRMRSLELDLCCFADQGPSGMRDSLISLRSKALDAVHQGVHILILSDRHVDRDHVAIPALLATAAVHQHLVESGLRSRIGLVIETGSAREVHHFAVLAAYGAEAIHPFLALETVGQRCGSAPQALTLAQATDNYIQAIDKGLLKAMSKMGISTFLSYVGGQTFDAVGLSRELVDSCFSGTTSAIQGIDLMTLCEETLRVHQAAWCDDPVLSDSLADGGDHAWRERGEAHMWTPDSIAHLQHAVRGNDPRNYAVYARLINEQSTRLMTLRGLLRLRLSSGKPVPLDAVEPETAIVQRFATGAMSLGSISTEAHTTLAIAMNRLGAKSNTGEGGEDPARYRDEMAGRPVRAGDRLSQRLPAAGIVRDQVLRAGDSLRSRIKQVASGRFGVTTAYLVSADQIQIKIAQGAKPGEGGQLPGHKVSPYIAHLRFSVPGVGLISPPPHHDIYSIEDIAQVIHDLKCVNPQASISVKLVSCAGIGTIAAGIAKAKADHIVISGHDGGTGAAAWSSILHAGSPWEMGLAEAQQTLLRNDLRGRIRIQVDGQIKTGHDVVIAALLGADEMGFATAPLVAMGCIQMRKGQANTCPTGIATQDPELRRRFVGTPEHVMNYFMFVAREVREIMARCGFRHFEDMIGRCDRLDMCAMPAHWKARGLDYSRLLRPMPYPGTRPRHHVNSQDHGLDKALDQHLIGLARSALEAGQPVSLTADVNNGDRSVGAMLSGEVIRHHGPAGLPHDTIRIHLRGTGGQSFGAFLASGITLDLEGQANDYLGKGLSGGRIIVRRPADFRSRSPQEVIAGNTVLYGATGGEAWINGTVGERFAVRNSGAVAVVEGVGDHGCEYMTNGTVVVLGDTGRNFAAGMSGGVAYVYDPQSLFRARCNLEGVTLLALEEIHAAGDGNRDAIRLKQLIETHVRCTGSWCAATILKHWETHWRHFIKVVPDGLRSALTQRETERPTDNPRTDCAHP